MAELPKEQPEILGEIQGMKEKLGEIEALLKESHDLLKISQTISRYRFIFNIGLAGMVAGMSLAVADPESAWRGLMVFAIGLLLSLSSTFPRQKG